jgi:hypothetical protein
MMWRASPDAACSWLPPMRHWTLLLGKCLRRIAQVAAMVIDVAYGPVAYKTQLFAYLLHRKPICCFLQWNEKE